MARLLPELTVAAYLLLGAATWAWGWTSEPNDWRSAFFAWLVVWTIAAIALVLRQRLALVVLLAIELLALFGWVEEPGDWLLFCAQVALVLLLLSSPMDRYVPMPPPPSSERASRLAVIVSGILLVGAFLVWAAVEAINGDAAAIPLLTIAFVFLILGRRVGAIDSTDAGGHS
jgi:hypothetical protein